MSLENSASESETGFAQGTYTPNENRSFAKFIIENDEEYSTIAELCREAAKVVTTRSGRQLENRYSTFLSTANIHHKNKLLTEDEKLKVANKYKPDLDEEWMVKNRFVRNPDGMYNIEERSSEQAETEKKDPEANNGESSSTVHDAEMDHKQSIKKEDPEPVPSIDERIEEALMVLKNLMIEKTSQFVSEDRVREMIEERLQEKK